MKTRTSSYRLEYLDWLRGLGAIIMLQGHVFDSFMKPELRPGGAWVLSQFAGGMPPAIFLFLTGVTLAYTAGVFTLTFAGASGPAMEVGTDGSLTVTAMAVVSNAPLSGAGVAASNRAARADARHCAKGRPAFCHASGKSSRGT